MPNNTVTDGIKIIEHARDDGGRTLVAYAADQPSWVAAELAEPIGGYRWQIFPFSPSAHLTALVWDEAAARAWLEHEAAHARLAAKVVAA